MKIRQQNAFLPDKVCFRERNIILNLRVRKIKNNKKIKNKLNKKILKKKNILNKKN